MIKHNEYFYMIIDPETMTWMLKDPECDCPDFDVWSFTYGIKYRDNKKFYCKKHKDGSAQLITFTIATATPIISQSIAELFREEESQSLVQLIPVEIEKENSKYFILNITNTVDCIIKNNGLDQFDSSKFYGNSIFRIKNNETVAIVSNAIKEKFDKIKLCGVVFHDLLDVIYFSVV